MIFDNNAKIIFANLPKNLCCGCSLESPRRGDSNEHPQHRFLGRNKQNYHSITSNIIKYAPYYVPPTEGGDIWGGHIVFGADPVGVCVRLASFPHVIF